MKQNKTDMVIKKKLELIPDKTIGAMKIHLIDPREGDKPEKNC